MLMINEEQEAINSFMSDFMTTFAIILAVIFLIMLIGYIVWKVAYWKIFSKAGEKGWKSLIPIYDQYVLCRIVGVSPWWLLICAASGILSSISGFFTTLFAAVSIYFSILVAIKHTNVDLSNPYTVLDISELTGDLLTVGMFVALDFVWDKAKEDRTKEKAIFIDEIWQLVGAGSNSMAAEFCLEIFKIIRGYGGAAIAATQDLNDFFALDGGKYGKGIINNAKTKIVLNLEDDEAIRVQDALKLTDTEIANITRFERGNGLISTNSNHITVEFKASALEKQLITTDRYELSQIVQNQS